MKKLALSVCLLIFTALLVSAQVVTLSLQTAQSSGNGTPRSVAGLSYLSLTVIGSSGADRVVNWEVSQDGTNYLAIMCTNPTTLAKATTTTATSTTAIIVDCPVAGKVLFRARLSGGATGTVTVTGTGLSGVSGISPSLGAVAASTDLSDSSNIVRLDAANVFSSATGQSVKKLLLPGSASGTLTVQAAAAAGATTLTLPGGTTDFSATGGTSQVVKQTSAGGAFTVAQLAASDLSNGTSGTGAVALANTPIFVTKIVVPEGTVGAPGMAWDGATTSGLYLSYAPGGRTAITALGAKIAEFGNDSGVAFYPPSGTFFDLQITGGGASGAAGHFLRNTEAASAGTTLRSSPIITLRGSYWNGSSSQSADIQMQGRVSATTPVYRLAFDVAGAEYFSILNNGNTGVGTTAPKQVLDVNGPIKTAGSVVASLPACNSNTIGSLYYVTDGLAPSFLVTIVGGGAVKTPVFCDGTNWVGA